MSQNQQTKICLIGECLSTGGAEKSMALLSQYFESRGISVNIVTVLDDISYPFAGTLLNLGKMKDASNGPFNKARRFLALYRFLEKHKFDCIIDFRIRVSFLQEFLISRILYNSPTVYTVHSSMTELYFPDSRRQARLIYRYTFGMVSVSQHIAEKVNQRFGLKSEVIPNPIDFANIASLSSVADRPNGKFILAAGRMKADIKQFGKLVETYSRTSLPQMGVRLVILGDGPDKPSIENTIEKTEMQEFVELPGFLENPYPMMKNAEFFVLSSKREGLPTVILESLACGTPVVSFDCVSGPSEIIQNRENGILVADQDFDALADAMQEMASDEQLLNRCRKNAARSVERFSIEKVGAQWMQYLKLN